MTALKETREFVPTKPGSSLSRGDAKGKDEAGNVRLLFTSPVTLGLFPPDWRGGAGSTAIEQEQSLRWLAGLYTFNDYVQVANFLRENPFLIDLLAVGYRKIQQYFGSDAKVGLEVFTDPEADESRQLVALVRTDLPWQEEADRRETFYEEWWLDVLPAARYKLHVDVE